MEERDSGRAAFLTGAVLFLEFSAGDQNMV